MDIWSVSKIHKFILNKNCHYRKKMFCPTDPDGQWKWGLLFNIDINLLGGPPLCPLLQLPMVMLVVWRADWFSLVSEINCTEKIIGCYRISLSFTYRKRFCYQYQTRFMGVMLCLKIHISTKAAPSRSWRTGICWWECHTQGRLYTTLCINFDCHSEHTSIPSVFTP